MPRWCEVATFGGVDLSDCRVLIEDREQFLLLSPSTPDAGSSEPGADGTAHIQLLSLEYRGRHFGASIPNCEAQALKDIRDVIMAGLANVPATPIQVHLQDALVDIQALCFPDFTVPKWLTAGPESEGMIENVILRFESVGSY